MKRVFGAVSGALRTLVPKANAPAVPHAAHQERVRKAMESLAPPGRRLPSESKALAMEFVGAASAVEKEMSLKTPEEMDLAANALYLVRSGWQEVCDTWLQQRWQLSPQRDSGHDCSESTPKRCEHSRW